MKALLRNAGLVVLAIVTVALCYVALTRDTDTSSAPDHGTGQSAAADPEDPGPADPSAPPQIVDQVRADFATSEQLPPGSKTYDNEEAGSPLQVRNGFLSHDPPKGPVAIGSLEVELSGPVHKLGARVIFGEGNTGSVNLVAWTSSLVAAREDGKPVPTSGLRLEATASDWQLTTYDKFPSVIAGDQFQTPDGPLTFEVYRSGSRAWVVDPTGKVTVIDNPAIGSLAGPWACWQVAEDSPGEAPAQIQSIWAG